MPDFHHGLPASVCAAAVVVALSLWAAAPAGAQSSKAARTPWGTPDLTGVWDFRPITPLQRPSNQADKEFLTEEETARAEQEVVERNRRNDGRVLGARNDVWMDGGTKPVSTRRTSLIIDPPNGRLPALTAAAQRRVKDRQAYQRDHPADSPEDRSASDRCLVGINAGPPLTPALYNQNMQVIQTRDHVALVTEMIHTARIVPLDGRPRLNDRIRQWSGEARGHWESDTLVIETTNFDERRGWSGATGGFAQFLPDAGASMKLIERLTRLDADTLEYKYTVIDPGTWTSPWTASIPLRLSDLPMYEYACHEGNYSMVNVLSGHRAAEREAAARR